MVRISQESRRNKQEKSLHSCGKLNFSFLFLLLLLKFHFHFCACLFSKYLPLQSLESQSVKGRLLSRERKTQHMQQQLPEVIYKKAVLKNFAVFTWKYLCWSLFLIKLQRNTYFENHMRMAAFALGGMIQAGQHYTQA